MRKYYPPNEGWTEPAEADGAAPQSAKFPALELSLAGVGIVLTYRSTDI